MWLQQFGNKFNGHTSKQIRFPAQYKPLDIITPKNHIYQLDYQKLCCG